jgi:hypothetical protein
MFGLLFFVQLITKVVCVRFVGKLDDTYKRSSVFTTLKVDS